MFIQYPNSGGMGYCLVSVSNLNQSRLGKRTHLSFGTDPVTHFELFQCLPC